MANKRPKSPHVDVDDSTIALKQLVVTKVERTRKLTDGPRPEVERYEDVRIESVAVDGAKQATSFDCFIGDLGDADRAALLALLASLEAQHIAAKYE